MKMKHLLPVLLALSLAACAHSHKQASTSTPATAEAKTAKTTEAMSATAISCTRKSDTRKLEVETKGEGCSLEYTKGGKTHSAASSAKGTKHCLDSQKKIREHLEKAGFKCA